MNTADYCAEGRELYAEYKAWLIYGESDWGMIMLQVARARNDAYRRFKEHVNGCPICSRKDE